ncbi:biopolymer transporter ExbD [bacterium BMS3Abin03]|jgi:biopolymer transport protein ExbD|nr:biopolymer transporter ExbD [bacterium BMS3Abin03]MCG6958309.1 biopolymer transporter ExbD [bacterium BMS3Abin03]
MKFNVSNKPLSIFSYSSLTDIVLLLVIFFLLTSQFVILTGVKVKLPGSKTLEQSEPTKLIVTVTAEGAIYAGQDQTGIDQLPAKLNEIKSTTPETSLIIRADKTVQIDLVIKIIDAAKSVGIGKFTIETQKEE